MKINDMINFTNGDLVYVTKRNIKHRGIVISSGRSNVYKSKHAETVNGSYPLIYYVLVEDNKIEGPFFRAELTKVN